MTLTTSKAFRFVPNFLQDYPASPRHGEATLTIIASNGHTTLNVNGNPNGDNNNGYGGSSISSNHNSSNNADSKPNIQRSAATRFLAGLGTFLSGLLILAFKGRTVYTVMITSTGVLAGVIVAIIFLGKLVC